MWCLYGISNVMIPPIKDGFFPCSSRATLLCVLMPISYLVLDLQCWVMGWTKAVFIWFIRPGLKLKWIIYHLPPTLKCQPGLVSCLWFAIFSTDQLRSERRRVSTVWSWPVWSPRPASQPAKLSLFGGIQTLKLKTLWLQQAPAPALALTMLSWTWWSDSIKCVVSLSIVTQIVIVLNSSNLCSRPPRSQTSRCGIL